jgi:hypothetical protein
MELGFSRQIIEKYLNVVSNLMKIHPVGADLFHADRRTDDGHVDMTKLIVTPDNVANAPTFRTAIYQP